MTFVLGGGKVRMMGLAVTHFADYTADDLSGEAMAAMICRQETEHFTGTGKKSAPEINRLLLLRSASQQETGV